MKTLNEEISDDERTWDRMRREQGYLLPYALPAMPTATTGEKIAHYSI